MRQVRHAITKVVYEEAGGGLVRVTNPDGASGVFTGTGGWVSGELRTADPEMCRWVDSGSWASDKLRTSRRFTTFTAPPAGQPEVEVVQR